MNEYRERVAQAAAILGKYNVGKNLTFLIDNKYQHFTDGIEWDQTFKSRDIPGGDRVQRFTYNGKIFEILAVNKTPSYSEREYRSDFTLVINGETILTTILKTDHNSEPATREVCTSSLELKQVKLGDWMKEIQLISDLCRENWKQVQKRMEDERSTKEKERLAKQAADIDFGDYKNSV